jgi:hypothetical protein
MMFEIYEIGVKFTLKGDTIPKNNVDIAAVFRV